VGPKKDEKRGKRDDGGKTTPIFRQGLSSFFRNEGVRERRGADSKRAKQEKRTVTPRLLGGELVRPKKMGKKRLDGKDTDCSPADKETPPVGDKGKKDSNHWREDSSYIKEDRISPEKSPPQYKKVGKGKRPQSQKRELEVQPWARSH